MLTEPLTRRARRAATSEGREPPPTPALDGAGAYLSRLLEKLSSRGGTTRGADAPLPQGAQSAVAIRVRFNLD